MQQLTPAVINSPGLGVLFHGKCGASGKSPLDSYLRGPPRLTWFGK